MQDKGPCISVTFTKRDDKESFLSYKWQLPSRVFVNEEYPLHIKQNRDKLRPIFRLGKSFPQYRDKSKMVNDKLIINGNSYGVEDIPTLPPDLAAYKVQKGLMTHTLSSPGN